MYKPLRMMLIFLLGTGLAAQAATNLIASGATVKKLAGGFRFTEGPAADRDGHVFFTDIPNSRIHKWSLDGELTTFLENSERANGLFFESDGSLLACQGGGRRLVRIGTDGSVSTLVSHYDGKRLNSLNDLWPDPKGGIYFTDPRYGNRDDMEQDGEHVYYLKPDRKTLIRVVDDMTRPNGVLGTPDGKTLYVADQGAKQTFVYTIHADGTLGNKRLFADQGSDGITMDEHGHVYLTTDAVRVYDPKGALIQTIQVPERPSNVCFGGAENKTLFITARTSLYALEMQVKGVFSMDITAPGAKLVRLSDRFKFTEGPAVDKWGNIFFTDQPNNKIWKWSSLDGQLTIFHLEPGRANGLYFDRQGKLLACADLNNELWQIDMQGNVTVLVKDYKAKKLNGPNDLWEDLKGGIYFTDPFYKRPYWQRGPMEQDGQHVYYLTPDKKYVIRVTDDLVQPNGIIGTPDGKKLYVADIGDKKTYVYDMKADGRLSNKTLFCSMGSDGMTIDNEGNVYLTGRGVHVFNRAGNKIKHIPIPSGWTANVCFGGLERNILFITAKESVYTLKMRVKGVK